MMKLFHSTELIFSASPTGSSTGSSRTLQQRMSSDSETRPSGGGNSGSAVFGALRATESSHRRTTPLDGIWSFLADKDDVGLDQTFYKGKGLPAAGRQPIAVPASWNEQIPELDAFLGPAWYSRSFWPPLGFDAATHDCVLRFASVNYHCQGTGRGKGRKCGRKRNGKEGYNPVVIKKLTYFICILDNKSLPSYQ
jgi:hypothetical protein